MYFCFTLPHCWYRCLGTMIQEYCFQVRFTFKPQSTLTLNEQLCDAFIPDFLRKMNPANSRLLESL